MAGIRIVTVFRKRKKGQWRSIETDQLNVSNRVREKKKKNRYREKIKEKNRYREKRKKKNRYREKKKEKEQIQREKNRYREKKEKEQIQRKKKEESVI